MPATTPGRNLPYPVGTDRLMDGDDQIRKLAQSVDNMIQAGTFTATLPGADKVNGTVTFPVAFAATPIVSLTLNQGSTATAFVVTLRADATPNGASPTQFSWTARTASGATSTGSPVINWIAIGPITPVS